MNNNNYPTWLVPLDIAKELKAIGFNKKTMFYFFSGDTTFKCSISEDIPLDYILPIEDIELDNYNRKGFYASIPAWEQVFEWFRDKGLFHSICITEDLIEDVKEFEAEIRDNNADIIYIIHRDTYEEVREALVKALIQTYKQEQLK